MQPVPWVWRVESSRAFPYTSASFGHQHVRYSLPGKVPSLDQYRPAAEGKQDLPGSAHLGGVADRSTAQNFSFRQIRGEYFGAGDQQLLQPIERDGIDQPCAALGDHDGIDDERDAGGAFAQRGGNRLDDQQIVQHACLDCIGPDVVEHDLDLLANKIGRDRQNAEDALGVLRSQRGDRRRRIGIEHRHGLDVGLDTGAAAGIRAGDDQYPAAHGYSAA